MELATGKSLKPRLNRTHTLQQQVCGLVCCQTVELPNLLIVLHSDGQTIFVITFKLRRCV
jgi:hypothetical protein